MALDTEDRRWLRINRMALDTEDRRWLRIIKRIPYKLAKYLLPPYFTDASGRQWRSWMVPMIIVSNIIMFAIIMFINNCPQNNILEVEGACVAKFLGRFSFQSLKKNPMYGPTDSTLEKLGALNWNKVVNGKQWWRVFTCMWLHAGVTHLLANMIALFCVGIRLEQQFGFLRVGAIYLLSGLGGSILSLLFLQNSSSVGASGAIFGIIGAMLSELFTNWNIYTNKVCAIIVLLIYIVEELAFGMIPFGGLKVDNFGHIGGVLSGFLLGFVLLLRAQPARNESQKECLPTVDAPTNPNSKQHTFFQLAFLLISLLLLISGFTVGIVLLASGKDGNDYCKWCHYLSNS